MEAMTLEPCPFCGGDSWVIDVPDTRRFRPQCSKCGADLGEFKRRADAVTAWNTRTHHAELEAGGRDAARLSWVGIRGFDNQAYSNSVLRRGGNGDLSDIRGYIDAAMRNSAREG